MDDSSKLVLIFSIVLSVCGYGAIIYSLYSKMFTFAGGLIVGFVLLTPMLSYIISKILIWGLESDSW